jgi:capsular polysaccharide biosynthesis protein
MIEVLWEFENDLTEFRDLRTKDERVANLRKQITVTVGTRVNPMTQQATVSSIKISCRNQSPEMAQRIANRLAELFLEDDYGIMEPPFHLPTDLR